MSFRASGPAPIRLVALSFVGLIALGAALLKLPVSTPPGQAVSWTDAFFTSASAACVTGLAVRDTGTGFTSFGQVVILGLIQLGGLGVMTFWLLIYWLLKGRISMGFRSVFERTLAGAIGDRFWPVLRLVFVFTLGCEALGAVLLALRFSQRMPVGEALWQGIFHAISAFCNAGFGLRPDSLVAYAADPWVNLTVMALIILGGLGFFAVYDLLTVRGTRRKAAVHSRLAVTVSAVLIGLGALSFWLFERGNSLSGRGAGEQLWISLFQSVTTRTAGFNTVDLAGLFPATLFLMILLMFVGGSPGSCAGGIKTTTLAVLVLAALSRLRGAKQVNLFGRTLDDETVNDAIAVTGGGIAVAVVGLMAVLVAEQGLPGGAGAEGGRFLTYFFETISALGTVGLSTGITPLLSDAAKWVIIVLMFIGRLGPLTVAMALAVERSQADLSYAKEAVMVG